MSLSDKIIVPKGQINQILAPMLPVDSVQEAVKELKEWLCICTVENEPCINCEKVREIFGDELI